MLTLFFILSAYFIGAIPSAKIIGLRLGVDIQKHGSGNIGFANSWRVLGWKPAILVLICDITKAFVPVALAGLYLQPAILPIIGLVAILGHIFPVYLNFKGGKGVATGLGATLAIAPLVGLLGVATYVIVFSVVKKSAVSSIAAALCLPIYGALLASSLMPYFICLTLLGVWTHRSNIQQLRAKTIVND